MDWLCIPEGMYLKEQFFLFLMASSTILNNLLIRFELFIIFPSNHSVLQNLPIKITQQSYIWRNNSILLLVQSSFIVKYFSKYPYKQELELFFDNKSILFCHLGLIVHIFSQDSKTLFLIRQTTWPHQQIKNQYLPQGYLLILCCSDRISRMNIIKYFSGVIQQYRH